MTTATTNTVLPCSSYLSAQFEYLEYQEYSIEPGSKNSSQLAKDLSAFGWLGGDIVPSLRSWNINFGQSPECMSYAKAMRSGEYTFSGCGSSNTVIPGGSGVTYDYPPEIPPGLVRLSNDGQSEMTCCGNCSLGTPEVRLYYFPDRSPIVCHSNMTSEYQRSNLTSVVSSPHLEKRVHSLIANGSTAVVSGHTLYAKHSDSRG